MFMAGSDTYLTIRNFAQGSYKEKGSTFISLAYPVRTVDEIKSILGETRKDHHSARHHCFAYILGQNREIWRSGDDGEPSGTAGKPILGQIRAHGLTNVLIVVVRYFGGRLLGTGGLINAYRSAAADAIKNCEIVKIRLHDFFMVEFQYHGMSSVMKIVRDHDLDITGQEFGETCRITIKVEKSSAQSILSLLSRIGGLKYTFLYSSQE